MEAERRLAHGIQPLLHVSGGDQSSGELLSRQVPRILDIGAGIEVGVAPPTFLGQLLAFYGLAMAFAARRGARPRLRSNSGG